jgi:hypothetical protein
MVVDPVMERAEFVLSGLKGERGAELRLSAGTLEENNQVTKQGPLIALVPLPSRSQFLNVIESVFGVMKKAVIHHSDYRNAREMKSAISQHFRERNAHFASNPRRAGTKIWDIDFFNDLKRLPSGNYREY